MNYQTRSLTTIILASLIVGSAVYAAKPAIKKPIVKVVPHYVKGTTQLSGENAQFGVVYTLGKTEPFNITLKNAEYTVDQVKVGDRVYTPKAEEKLLVMHFTYHNPNRQDRFMRWDSFKFTIVDPQDQNHVGLLALGMEKDASNCAMSFKPAQKVDVFGVMSVPASGEMPKLIIESSDKLVLRYDLRGKVKKLPADIADPSDSAGATPLAVVDAKPSVNYPMGEHFRFTFDGAEFNSSDKLGDLKPDKKQTFAIVKFTLKNIGARAWSFRWDAIANKLVDVDGVALGSARGLLLASRDNSFAGPIEPGQEMKLRWVYRIPKDTPLKTFSIVEPDKGRTYNFDISSVKP